MAAAAADHLYPVDIKEDLEMGVHRDDAKLLEEAWSAMKGFSVPGQENVKLETSAMNFLPLYRDDSKYTLLVLMDPQDKTRVLAVYLHNSWWLIEDVAKTSDPSREGLIQVQTFQERVVLFVLNCIIFGVLERSLTYDADFVPHPKKEYAKIFWRSGEAAAFYTIKGKGSLYDGLTSQCYALPVLDTMFVRKKFRRRGLGMQMLHDFCQTFPSEDALGLSCPLSAEMEKVCQRFLETYPEEQSRLWQVEAPGYWAQRVNIWLNIQLGKNLPRKEDLNCCPAKSQDDEDKQSDGGPRKTALPEMVPPKITIIIDRFHCQRGLLCFPLI